MARTDKYKKTGGSSEVDLLPFMNLLAILIPALMISTEYIKIATIDVSSPRIGPKSEAVEKTDEKPPLNLNIVASSLGLYIASANNTLPGAEEQAADGPTIPKVNVQVYKGMTNGKQKELLRVWGHKGKKFTYGAKEISSEELNQKLANLKKSTGGAIQQSDELDYNYPVLREKLIVIKEAFKDAKGNDQVIISADPNIKFTTMIRIMDTARSRVNDAGEKEWLFPQVVLSAGVS